MLKRHLNTLFCPDCDKSWHFMESSTIREGGECPSDACPSRKASPLGAVIGVCNDFDGNGIFSVGANAALLAMRRHWADHLAEGHEPTIIASDIDEMMRLMTQMKTEIMKRIGIDAGLPDGDVPGDSLARIFAAAQQHAEDTGEAEHQVGDLEDVIREAWSLMDGHQQRALLGTDCVKELLQEEGDDEGLSSYVVTLKEDPEADFAILFECWAEDSDHATEQAQDAYPGCEIVSCCLAEEKDAA